MPQYRKEKLASLIKQEISKIIVQEFDFNDTLATITIVDLSSKLDHADVGVSVIPSIKEDFVMHELSKREKELEWRLMKKLNIRFVPHLRFRIDKGMESSAQVEKLLKDE